MEFPQTLLEEETRQIIKRYKSTPEQVYEILMDVFSQNEKLLAKINASYPEEDVTRWRAYKSAIKEVRKRVYYELRQYHQDEAIEEELNQKLSLLIEQDVALEKTSELVHQLLETHISTRERVSHIQSFYQQIEQVIDKPERILDVGCGINPLSFPFYAKHEPLQYLAVDKDGRAIELLQKFSKLWKALRAEQQDITDFESDAIETPDLVLMLKVVPVVHRHQKTLLDKLARCKGRIIVVTGSSTAMTKKKSIRHREDKVLQQFIELSGRKIVGKIELPDEFGYLLQ